MLREVAAVFLLSWLYELLFIPYGKKLFYREEYLIAVFGRLCVCSAVVVRLVGDNRLCVGFLVILLFID